MRVVTWGFAAYCVFLLGCGVKPAAEIPSTEAPPAGSSRTVTDSFGHTATLTGRPARIVSTAPSNTEVLFAVGAGPQVVGVTTYCNYPDDAARCEKVGGYSPKSLSVEKIVALRPDLVLTTGRLQQPLTDSLRKLGLVVLCFDVKTLEDVISNVRMIGQAAGRAEEAEQRADDLQRRLEAVKRRTAGRKESDRPRVFFLLSEDPLMTAGPSTFPGQMIALAGGVNVFADVDQQFPRVSEEEILKRDPAVVLLALRKDGSPSKERIRQRPGWDKLDAVRSGRVLEIEDDLISRPGPRLFDGMERLAELLRPATGK
jgi:iron complex transport system substrate-binding protein